MLAAAVLAAACGHSPPPPAEHAGDAQPLHRGEASSTSAASFQNVPDLLADVATARACHELSGKYLAMSAKAGTSFQGGKEATVGTLLVESCKVDEVAPHELTVSLAARGWKWIDRTSEKALADFTVAQYLRFGIDASVAGTLDMHYAPDEHVLNFWFRPTRKPETRFTPLQDLEVDEEGLWSELVGAGATLAGADPDDKADTKAKKKGGHRLEDKFSGVFSIAYDLCTSRSFTKTGRLEPGELPTPSIVYHDDRDYEVNSDAVLHPGGLLMAGPFAEERKLVAEVVVSKSSAPASVSLLCEEDAKQVTEAFLDQKPAPPTAELAVAEVTGGKSRRLELDAPNCKPVLMLTPSQGNGSQRVELKYSVYFEGAEREPLAPCPMRSRERPSTAAK